MPAGSCPKVGRGELWTLPSGADSLRDPSSLRGTPAPSKPHLSEVHVLGG